LLHLVGYFCTYVENNARNHEPKIYGANILFHSNEELNRLIENKNIINYIKAQTLAWFGHVNRMQDDRMVKKVYKLTPMSTRSIGRPKNKWEDDIKMILKT
jgi:hypothetical protein